ncbi:TRAP transporter substrate-binding protein DctP [Dokdonella sp.]|uniref:TRAP transporter substrate-binding protein n=1 Tax=Dokdonella sp. TaxID=2291710 RepID=UPI0026211C82|nr:TRAP transporter substrate-binding protein DctP [Dokdonella sp.]
MTTFNKLSLALALAFAATGAEAATLKIATMAPDGTNWMKEMRAGADAIKAKTEGRVELKFYPGGVMGDASTVLRKIKIGQLQGGAFTGGEASVITKDAQAYTVPFLFRTQQEVDQVRAKVDPLLKEQFRKNGFELLGVSGGGFAYLMSTRELKTRDDLRSAKVWVPQGDAIAEATFKAAGVAPIPLPLSDVYTSLQTGLIDTAANTTAGAIAFQWHTKVKYVVDLPVIYTIGELAVDKKAFDALSEADRKTVGDEIAAAFAQIDKQTRADNTSARAALEKEGIRFVAPDASERGNWEAVGADAQKRLATSGALSPEIQKALEAALAEARGGAK